MLNQWDLFARYSRDYRNQTFPILEIQNYGVEDKSMQIYD